MKSMKLQRVCFRVLSRIFIYRPVKVAFVVKQFATVGFNAFSVSIISIYSPDFIFKTFLTVKIASIISKLKIPTLKGSLNKWREIKKNRFKCWVSTFLKFSNVSTYLNNYTSKRSKPYHFLVVSGRRGLFVGKSIGMILTENALKPNVAICSEWRVFWSYFYRPST